MLSALSQELYKERFGIDVQLAQSPRRVSDILERFRLPSPITKFPVNDQCLLIFSKSFVRFANFEQRRTHSPKLLLTRKSGIFHIYGTYEIIMFMKQESIRTTVDIPAPLYRKLKEQAAETGSSIRELVLLGVRRVVLQAQRPRPKRVEFPLIVSKGPQVDLTNEQIYEHVEFP